MAVATLLYLRYELFKIWKYLKGLVAYIMKARKCLAKSLISALLKVRGAFSRGYRGKSDTVLRDPIAYA